MSVDDSFGTESVLDKHLKRPAHVARREMKRRHQRQIVVVHSAGIDTESGASGAAAEEDHPSSGPDRAHSFFPSCELAGRFNHQVRTAPAVQGRETSERLT